MAAIRDLRQKQRAVIGFLVCVNEIAGNVQKRFQNVYGEDTAACSTFSRWTVRTPGKCGHGDIRDLPRSGRPLSDRKNVRVQRIKTQLLRTDS
jgi:hypothetical protein